MLEYYNLQNKHLVAIDPDQCDLLYCVDDDSIQSKHFRYSQDLRRECSKFMTRENPKPYRNNFRLVHVAQLSELC